MYSAKCSPGKHGSGVWIIHDVKTRILKHLFAYQYLGPVHLYFYLIEGIISVLVQGSIVALVVKQTVKSLVIRVITVQRALLLCSRV